MGAEEVEDKDGGTRGRTKTGRTEDKEEDEDDQEMEESGKAEDETRTRRTRRTRSTRTRTDEEGNKKAGVRGTERLSSRFPRKALCIHSPR